MVNKIVEGVLVAVILSCVLLVGVVLYKAADLNDYKYYVKCNETEFISDKITNADQKAGTTTVRFQDGNIVQSNETCVVVKEKK